MGHGGSQTQTTTQSLPPEVAQWAGKYLNALGNLVLPGGQLAQSPLPYQEVAPLDPQQVQGMNLVSSETYGPSGPPQGGNSTAAQGGSGADPSQLMQGIMASPYWGQQFQQNPWMQRAFSQPALQQIAQMYMGLQ